MLNSFECIPYVESSTGGTLNGGGFNPIVRRSQIKWIPKTNEYKDLYKKIVSHCKSLNEKTFFLNLNKYENIQYTEYTDKDWGTYNWHIDTLDMPDDITHRKLSVVVFLDNDDDFTGGNFLIDDGGSIKSIKQTKGTMVVFNSFISHCVTPIVYGKRKSLVLWISGPKEKIK